MNDIKRGALYIRVSTDDQTEYSPDSQIKLCYKYAKEHNIEILKEHIYQEDGISGTNVEKRTSFKRMIATAKKKPKPFDVILIYSFSRFARNREDAIMYKSLLRKKLGIDVVSITQPLSEGKESILMEALYEAMDEYYSVDLAEQSIRGKIEKASRGEHQGGTPYGYIYDKNTKTLYPDKEKAEIVKLIFKEWIKPEQSIRGLCRMLNDMNILTTRGCKWSDRSMYLILQNPAYIGYSRFTVGGMKRNYKHPDTITAKGKWEPIIDMKTWNLAKQKMDDHDKKWFKYKKHYTKNEFWLRGIVKCSDCGKSLVRCNVKGKPVPFFQCTGFTKGRCQDSHYIRQDQLVPAILEQIKKDYTDKLNIKITEGKDTPQYDQISIIKKNIEKLKTKRERIKEAYINEIDTLEEYKENKKKLDNEEKQLKEQLKELNYKEKQEVRKEKTYELCKTAYEILSDEETSFDLKDDVAHRLFDHITYNKKENTLEIVYK